MGKPNEQSGGTQQRAGSAKDDARAKGEATKTKERAELEKRAHDLSVDLDSVRGTDPGGQVTLLDVEFAQYTGVIAAIPRKNLALPASRPPRRTFLSNT